MNATTEIKQQRRSAVSVDVAAYLRPGTINLHALPPLALYVHYPWCVRKCPYCDFNSHERNPQSASEVQYLDAVRADIEAALPLIWGRRIVSIFFGGGTPSLMSAEGLDRLLSDIRALLPLAPDCEITLEANPGTVEAERFASYRASGVNRLSIGIQSFDDKKLRALGRIHDRAQALTAIEFAQRHFDNFNLDLMYGLPGQSMVELQADIECALAARPAHLSLYQLTLEPNTVFAKFPPTLPDEDTVATMQDWLEERTARAALHRYEVSAYAAPARECRHNLNYWTFGDYLGVGAGAHSKISFPHRIVRQARFRQPMAYMERAAAGEFVAESHEISRSELPFEFMLNALRLTGGVPTNSFLERTGVPLSSIEHELDDAERRGFLVRNHQTLGPSALGLRFLSDLQTMFLKAGSP